MMASSTDIDIWKASYFLNAPVIRLYWEKGLFDVAYDIRATISRSLIRSHALSSGENILTGSLATNLLFRAAAFHPFGGVYDGLILGGWNLRVERLK